MKIIKKDGRVEKFDINKIKNTVSKAFRRGKKYH